MRKQQIMITVGFFGALMMAASAVGFSDQQFDELDLDKNGSLSPMEASSSRELSFAWNAIDLDQSDTLDRSEFNNFQRQQKTGAEPDMPGETEMPEKDRQDREGDSQRRSGTGGTDLR